MRQMKPSRNRYFDYLEKQGKLPKREDEEMAFAEGGEVPELFGISDSHHEEFDPSDEPSSEDEIDYGLPVVELNSRKSKRMAMGGRVPNSSFARALRKAH